MVRAGTACLSGRMRQLPNARFSRRNLPTIRTISSPSRRSRSRRRLRFATLVSLRVMSIAALRSHRRERHAGRAGGLTRVALKEKSLVVNSSQAAHQGHWIVEDSIFDEIPAPRGQNHMI